ncbi:endonuclease/exonuclease/phosphatase family protein [Halosquirtibacter xylanolyticus]|uniref:endonuclease/exonuclease/phosphatase family protein n=1 Tax=Halosquirtibacter xylanolyticus TaxID=3374599 RepID=UPI00374A8B12|nr:endonuclease/exonuclease/phosphatase family protein [Prolixibacteraceae bacterium]
MKKKRGIISFIGVVVAILTIVSSLSYHIPPDLLSISGFFSLLFPLFFLLNVILFIFFYSRLKKRYSIIAILISIPLLNNFLSFDASREVFGESDPFKVISYNIKSHRLISPNKIINKDIGKLIQTNSPDVVCLQEVNISGLVNNKQLIIGGKSYYIYHSGKSNVILSRYRYIHKEGIDIGDTNNSVIYADIEINNSRIRVYNCHLQSFRINPSEYKLYDTLRFKTEKQRMIKGKEFLKKMNAGFKVRAKQARIVKEHVSACPSAVLVCGDFNSTPSSYTYHILKKGLEDSFVERGYGYGASYRRNLVGVRIDYLLHSDDISTNSYKTFTESNSDHVPIMATYHIK